MKLNMQKEQEMRILYPHAQLFTEAGFVLKNATLFFSANILGLCVQQIEPNTAENE